ncbi:membrane bound o-acyl transferase family protein [Hirsutella rhossiliensis]|uniref:Membrane bound o-acyl transferase family domain-containing protein n=1 Tax=Hirsutella rhossiliensis TaxID=111463 RepID=A0A9P8SHV8_9HYPO|nr:membrane bound o-acyl transferase family domain-containing protein [Hirsutella rhossiliensis]KAH0961970.1 membrane bound o-acyl transferase family domain-containing protein [Hirsutella rhossiliensis]
MICMNLLIWSRPQFDAARVLKIPKRKGQGSCTGDRVGVTDEQNGVKRNGVAVASPRLEQIGVDAEFDYIWQRFPVDAPFLERFCWAADAVLSPRGAGWNWSISSIPRPYIPRHARDGERVVMEAVPRVTKSGFQRCLSETEFVYTRFNTIIRSYIVLDLVSILMEQDFYFAVGPGESHQRPLLPRYLQVLPRWLLTGYRVNLSLVACLSHISFEYSIIDLMQHWTMRTLFPSRSGLWMHASAFGSFSQVLDRGLAGWWGDYWHQTFRVPFLAPATFLIREGYIKPGTAAADAVAIFVSFFQSGLLHASGSLSSVANTKPWRPLLFFLIQAVGIIVERAANKWLRQHLPPLPKRLQRAANLGCALASLFFAGMLYFSDVASAGLWTPRPVPFSLFRGFAPGLRRFGSSEDT